MLYKFVSFNLHCFNVLVSIVSAHSGKEYTCINALTRLEERIKIKTLVDWSIVKDGLHTPEIYYLLALCGLMHELLIFEKCHCIGTVY